MRLRPVRNVPALLGWQRSGIDVALIGGAGKQNDVWRWSERLRDALFPRAADCVLIEPPTNPEIIAHIRRIEVSPYER